MANIQFMVLLFYFQNIIINFHLVVMLLYHLMLMNMNLNQNMLIIILIMDHILN